MDGERRGQQPAGAPPERGARYGVRVPERTSPARSPRPTRSAGRGRLARGGCAALVLLGLGGYAVVHHESGRTSPPHCTVADPDGERTFTLDLEQAASAATIGAVGSARQLPERAVAVALATAMQESSLRNIDYGDRDSLGLFQQRPSMGWGTEEEIMDPVYAAGKFYEELVELPDYLSMPLTEAAQAVQRSAYPDAYAQHEPEAALLAAALTGRRPAALSCTTRAEPAPGEPAEVQRRLVREFGDAVAPTSDGAELTVRVPTAEGGRQGWELAHWSVAHSAELGIARIAYGHLVWEAERGHEGWREAAAGDPPESETAAGTPASTATADDGRGGGNASAELRLSLHAPADA